MSAEKSACNTFNNSSSNTNNNRRQGKWINHFRWMHKSNKYNFEQHEKVREREERIWVASNKNRLLRNTWNHCSSSSITSGASYQQHSISWLCNFSSANRTTPKQHVNCEFQSDGPKNATDWVVVLTLYSRTIRYAIWASIFFASFVGKFRQIRCAFILAFRSVFFFFEKMCCLNQILTNFGTDRISW